MRYSLTPPKDESVLERYGGFMTSNWLLLALQSITAIADVSTFHVWFMSHLPNFQMAFVVSITASIVIAFVLQAAIRRYFPTVIHATAGGGNKWLLSIAIVITFSAIAISAFAAFKGVQDGMEAQGAKKYLELVNSASKDAENTIGMQNRLIENDNSTGAIAASYDAQIATLQTSAQAKASALRTKAATVSNAPQYKQKLLKEAQNTENNAELKIVKINEAKAKAVAEASSAVSTKIGAAQKAADETFKLKTKIAEQTKQKYDNTGSLFGILIVLLYFLNLLLIAAKEKTAIDSGIMKKYELSDIEKRGEVWQALSDAISNFFSNKIWIIIDWLDGKKDGKVFGTPLPPQKRHYDEDNEQPLEEGYDMRMPGRSSNIKIVNEVKPQLNKLLKEKELADNQLSTCKTRYKAMPNDKNAENLLKAQNRLKLAIEAIESYYKSSAA